MFISLEEDEFEAVGNDFYTPKKRVANGFFRFQRKLVGIQNKWRFKGISYAEQGISKLVNDPTSFTTNKVSRGCKKRVVETWKKKFEVEAEVDNTWKENYHCK